MFAGLTSCRVLRFSLIALALVLIALTSFPVFAQDDPAKKERPRRVLPAESEPQDILKIDTDLVPLDVTVTDAKGRLECRENRRRATPGRDCVRTRSFRQHVARRD